ncbi:MAG: transposase, partial [Anaerolineae bacterium]|nr:transposase [Anaerolineae bacterium]
LTHIGPDVSKWPTAGHFASWLGLSPNNKVSGGKVKGRHTRKTDNPVARALRLSAQAAGRSDSALGAFYRRMKARHGAPVANVATAHKLARIVYYMLKHRVDYHDPGAFAYDEQQRQRMLRRLQ